MKLSAQIQAAILVLIADAKKILDGAIALNRDMSADESKRVDEIHAEIATKKKAKARAEAQEALQAEADATEPALATLPTPGAAQKTNITTHDNSHDNPTRGYDGHDGFGKFAAEVHAFSTGQGASKGILNIQAAAGDGMSLGIKADGGVLTPPAFSTQIQERMTEADSLLEETDQLPSLPNGVESMTYPVVDETSRADGSRAGGIQGRWKSELTQMTETKPKLREVTFKPNELYVFCYVSDKLLGHAPQLSSFLVSRAADEINFKLGDAVINGTGGGQPRGVIAGAVDAPRVQIAKETGQAPATVVITNLEKMYARMPVGSINTSKWYINQDVLPALFSMTKAVGTGGVPVFMPGNNIAGAPYGSIFGRPIKPIEYGQTLGTEGDIIFADLKQYGTMTRGGVQTGMSIHLKFDYAQTAFRFIFEADGQPWISSSLTPKNGTAKRSPFITLATRS